MKTRNTLTKLITITMAVAALAAAGLLSGTGWLQPVEAQDLQDEHVTTVTSTSIYVHHGESVRVSVANTFFNPDEEGSQPVRVQAYIYDSYGNLLTQTDPVELRPGQFHTFDLNRDDLRVAGEEDTGRLQVRAGIQVALMDGSVRPVKLSVSIERVDNRTGGTSTGTYFTGTVTVSDDGF